MFDIILLIVILNCPADPWINPKLIMVGHTFIYCWIWLTNILLRTHTIYSLQVLVFKFVFVVSLPGLVTKWNELESVLSSSVFLNTLRRISISSSLGGGRIYLWRCPDLDFLFSGNVFLTANLISVLVIGLCNYLFLLVSFLVSVCLWKFVHSFYVVQFVGVGSHNFSYFCNIGYSSSFYISLCYSLSLISSGEKLKFFIFF